MTYPDAISYLGHARRFGMKLGLETMRELARALGNPHEQLRFIHIAGTNGKGSTAAFCESILRAAGFRTGLYTSPHLVSVRERVQINRVPISEIEFGEGMAAVRAAAEKVENQEPTFFELMTALALWYFSREKVDWVVWETGLGGRLDATNMVTPEVCIITNIGLDHQQYLGRTLAEIAAEKAGIIKRGVPVVTGVEKGEARDVILERVKRKKCLSTFIPAEHTIDLGLREGRQMAELSMGYEPHEFVLGLSGFHQAKNAACAVAAIDQLRWGHGKTFNPPEHPEITVQAVEIGLAKTRWPGRFDIVSEKPLIILDGAHNPSGMKMLVETWRAFLASRFGWSAGRIDHSTRVVFAAVADKDISEMAEVLRPIAKEVSLVRLANERSAEPVALAEAFSGLNCACYNSVTELWPKLVSDTESIILITGSLFLVGEMLARRSGNTEEYLLNEQLEKSTVCR